MSSASHSAICSGVRRSRLYSALGVKLRSQPVKTIPFSSHLHEVEQRTDLDRQPMALFENSDDLRVRVGGRVRRRSAISASKGVSFDRYGMGAPWELQANQSTIHSASSNGIRASFEVYSNDRRAHTGEIEKSSNVIRSIFDVHNTSKLRLDVLCLSLRMPVARRTPMC